VAAATMAAFAGIVMSLSRLPGHDAATLADRLAVARRPDVIAVLFVTLLGTIGSFSVYTYLAPFLQGTVGFSGHAVAGVLLLFGLSGLVGNVGGGIALDRWGPRLVLTVVLSIMAAALATLSLAPAAVESRVAAIVCCSAIAVWSAFGWSFPIGQQTRLVSLEPSLGAIALSLNWSATALGVSIGAALGGVVVAHGAISAIGWLGATFQIFALVALLLLPVHPGARSGLRIPS
jgi:predicted MFS family arabinose efflux permease